MSHCSCSGINIFEMPPSVDEWAPALLTRISKPFSPTIDCTVSTDWRILASVETLRGTKKKILVCWTAYSNSGLVFREVAMTRLSSDSWREYCLTDSSPSLRANSVMNTLVDTSDMIPWADKVFWRPRKMTESQSYKGTHRITVYVTIWTTLH